MLSHKQIKFRDNFSSPFKQRLFYFKNLPMALISGIKLTRLDEEQSIAEVPYRWRNKNPFRSMYFAVLSMAAELSTGAPALLALKGTDADVVLIIVDLKAEFVKKAMTKITFVCEDYQLFHQAISQLKQVGDMAEVTATTVGRNIDGDEVARFEFTWSFKLRS
ncbi:MAG: thioesterase [Thiotrichaceae bacterium]|nr:MAG: thioesterase [Thiotrichaceae bacterium]